MLEKEWQAQIRAYAKRTGWRTVHLPYLRGTPAEWRGFPDLLMLREMRGVVAELKVGKRLKPSDGITNEQAAWLAEFKAAGFEAYEWWPDDWAEVQELLA